MSYKIFRLRREQINEQSTENHTVTNTWPNTYEHWSNRINTNKLIGSVNLYIPRHEKGF